MARLSNLALALAALSTVATNMAIGPRPSGQSSWYPENAMGNFPGIPLGDIPSTIATMVSSVPPDPNPAMPSHTHPDPPFRVPSNATGVASPPETFPPFSATAAPVDFPTSRPAMHPRWMPYFEVPVNDTRVGEIPNSRPSMRPGSIPPFAIPVNQTGVGWFPPSRPVNGTGVGWFPHSRPVNETGAGWFPPSRPANATGFPTSRPSIYARSNPPFPRPNATATASFNSTIPGLPLCSGPPVTYTVAHMDTIDKIAAVFNVSVDALESANAGKVLYWDLLESGIQLEACSQYRPTGHVATSASSLTPTMTSMTMPNSSPAFGPQSPPNGPFLVTGSLGVTAFNRQAGATTPEVMYTTFRGNGSITDGWPRIADWLSWDAQWDNVKNYIGTRCGPNITPNSDAETQELGTFVLTTAGDAQIDPRLYLAFIMETSNGCIRGPQIDNAKLADALNEAGADPNMDPAQAYYHAARMYNSGSDGMSSSAASCYASDIANRLRGWNNGSTGRSPCNSE